MSAPSRLLRIAILLVCLPAAAAPAQTAPVDNAPLPPDPYLWLEQVHSPRAMAWVKEQDARSAKVFAADPHFAKFDAEALRIYNDPHRLPWPAFHGDDVYNFWTDQAHPRGILRRTTIADYRNDTPHWQTVLDIDALGHAEHVAWVFHGMTCLYPGNRYCIVDLSAGGEDASTSREFDLKAGKFVSGGFDSPHSKQSIAWLDANTLLIARDWGAGSMTSSGYPFVVKEWKRGTPLDSATVVFRGQASDLGVDPMVLHDDQGHRLVLIARFIDIFHTQWMVQTPAGLRELALPPKSSPVAMLDGRLIVQTDQDWAPNGSRIPQGSLVSLPVSEVLHDPAHLNPTVVFSPSSQEFLDGVANTRSRLIVITLRHVLGRAYVYTPVGSSGWTHRALHVPDNSTIGVITASNTNNNFYLYAEGFLTPPALLAGNAATGMLTLARSQPPMFDASGDVVQQFYATSKDGTRIPYFIVHARNMPLNGRNPTLLTAYGGFEISMTPSYSGILGKLWLEHGGVYVLANIRGGGEFGPAWHEAAIKTHRQRAFDDFYAVAQDLVARHIASPEHLGIEGASNGGLLMGVEMTQHPAMWKAVVIGVPLLDMLRYEQIEAGASWVGEYGSVKIPAQRAFLAKISPYNQLKPGVHYPEPFLFTTTRDDRVGPQHARKFTAKMEAFHDAVLYDEVTEGGHALGADPKEEAHTEAEIYTYLTAKLF